MKHKVALVDDHHLMRGALAGMIDQLDGYRVSLQAANGKDFIRKLDDDDPPTIAIVDIHMPIMDGYKTFTWLRQNRPKILGMALTFDGSDDTIAQAIRCGARGFILKNIEPKLLKKALDSLILTGYYHDDALHDLILKGNSLLTEEERERQQVIDRISPREMQFLLLVCDESELTYDKIAKVMMISRRSVDNFRRSLFAKFNIKSKTGLVLLAAKYRLLDDDQSLPNSSSERGTS